MPIILMMTIRSAIWKFNNFLSSSLSIRSILNKKWSHDNLRLYWLIQNQIWSVVNDNTIQRCFLKFFKWGMPCHQVVLVGHLHRYHLQYTSFSLSLRIVILQLHNPIWLLLHYMSHSHWISSLPMLIHSCLNQVLQGVHHLSDGTRAHHQLEPNPI